MAKSAVLSVRIVGDASNAVGAMSKAENSVGKFKASTAAAFGAVSGAVSSLVGKAIDYVGGLTGEMVEASDSAQSFADTLKFAGINDKQIKALTASTQVYADKTVFSLNDIRNTTAQLAANSVPDFDKLATASGNLTAVAGGGADAYRSVAQALVQTNGAGKLTTENWNQLTNAIPGAAGKLQQALKTSGAYTGDFRDAMAKGKISAQELNRAILDLGNSPAAIKAATNTDKLSSAQGNLDAGIVKLGSSLINLVKPQLTSFMTGLGDKISGIADNLPTIINNVQKTATQVGSFAQKIASIAQYVLPAVAAISLFVGGMRVMYAVLAAGSILKWVGTLTMAKSVVGGVTAAVNFARNAQAAFNLVLSANPIGVVIIALAALAAGLTWFFTKTRAGQQAWAAFTGFIGPAFQRAGGVIRGVWNNIVGWGNSAAARIRGAWNGLSGFFSGVGAAISAPFNTAFAAIRGAWNRTIGGKGFDVPKWVPGVGGKSFRIPMLAKGGNIANGGTVLVGEAGPEFLTLPRGAQVTPLDAAKPATIINITVNGALDAEAVALQIKRIMRDYDNRRA